MKINNSSLKWYILFIVILSVTSVVGVVSTMDADKSIEAIGVKKTPLIDTCMAIKLSVTEAHLWFEETMTGYEQENTYEISLEKIDHAKALANEMLVGSQDIMRGYPLEDEEARKEMVKVIDFIDEFKSIADERFKNLRLNEQDDYLLDDQLDRVYWELIKSVDTTETILKLDLRSAIETSRRDLVIVRSFFILMALATTGVVYFLMRSLKTAHDASPLTDLPGNQSIDKTLIKSLRFKRDVTVIHADLDNFKQFNDSYGFTRGDEVIKFTGRVLVSLLDRRHAFVGHIGGDDFVVILERNQALIYIENVLEKFDKEVITFYRQKDLADNRMVCVDREGGKKEFPILSISLAVVHLADIEDKKHASVDEKCALMKKKAKGIKGSSYAIYEKKK